MGKTGIERLCDLPKDTHLVSGETEMLTRHICDTKLFSIQNKWSFFPVSLTYNWHKTLYTSKVYNIMIWYMYILPQHIWLSQWI